MDENPSYSNILSIFVDVSQLIYGMGKLKSYHMTQ